MLQCNTPSIWYQVFACFKRGDGICFGDTFFLFEKTVIREVDFGKGGLVGSLKCPLARGCLGVSIVLG